MNSIYEPTLFLRDGKEMVKFYTMDRPKYQKFTQDRVRTKYALRLKLFLASAVEYPVYEGSKELLKKEMFDKIFFGKWTYEKISEQINSTGIRIDELADRLEVVEICKGTLKPCESLCRECDFDAEKQIRLRPEVKEESQEELWADILDTVERTPSNELIKLFKQQFTIKRNP